MKKLLAILWITALCISIAGCTRQDECVDIAATTLPVYEFTVLLCQDTGLRIGQLVTDNISCLHEYTLKISQMRMIESANAVVISGGGLEDFLDDALSAKANLIDASEGITLSCHTSHDEIHHHEEDPHYWLNIPYAKQMAENICKGLQALYPKYSQKISNNLAELVMRLDALQLYAEKALSELSGRDLITFHDGFSYFAENHDLHILKAIEEEAGSEASAAQLCELIELVNTHAIPAIFTEKNGSSSAAQIISNETGVKIFTLDMAISGSSYFDAMYHNIDTIKEALK